MDNFDKNTEELSKQLKAVELVENYPDNWHHQIRLQHPNKPDAWYQAAFRRVANHYFVHTLGVKFTDLNDENAKKERTN